MSFFKNLRGGSNPSVPAPRAERDAGGGGPIIAALLLETPGFDLDLAQRELFKAKIAGQTPRNPSDGRDGVFAFDLVDELVAVASMGVPYPWKDLEGPSQTSWMWPATNPATNLKRQQGHVLVTSMKGQSDPVVRRVIFTHMMRRLARLPGVIAVYWPEATLLHQPSIFVEMSKSAAPKSPPLFLWVDARVFREPDGRFGCFTTGLACLGLMEMEVRNMRMQPGDLRIWVMNIAKYMLERGSPIPNGDTIGATAGQQLKVQHGPSSFGAAGLVMRFSA